MSSGKPVWTSAKRLGPHGSSVPFAGTGPGDVHLFASHIVTKMSMSWARPLSSALGPHMKAWSANGIVLVAHGATQAAHPLLHSECPVALPSSTSCCLTSGGALIVRRFAASASSGGSVSSCAKGTTCSLGESCASHTCPFAVRLAFDVSRHCVPSSSFYS